MKVLITHPGKFGDLIYALPAVIELQKFFNREVHFQISEYCRPLKKLLEVQPYIKEVFISEDYKVANFDKGCQPWEMPEPEGYDKIFHLGIRPDREINHLIETPFEILREEYNVELPVNKDQKYLFLEKRPPHSVNALHKDCVVFNMFGESFVPLNNYSLHLLDDLWQDILKVVDEECIAVSGQRESFQYKNYDVGLICPIDFYETACMINYSRCFVGVQSACAAIANGLKVPRIILCGYTNAIPTGDNFKTIELVEPIGEVTKKLREFVKIKSNVFILKGLAKEYKK